MENSSMVAGSITSVLVMLLSLAILDARMLPAAPFGTSMRLSILCAATGTVSWLVVAPAAVPGAVGPMYLPVAALGGVAAYLATIVVRAKGGGTVTTLVFGSMWSIFVFVPTAGLSFFGLPSDVQGLPHPVDHGGSLAVNVAAGAAALGVLLSGRVRLRTATIRRSTGVIAVIGLCLGWLAWLVSAEMAIDTVSRDILLNGLAGAGGGVVGWLIVQRIRHQSTTLNAVAAGLVSGLVAVTAGASLFTPVSAIAAGVLAGAAACIFTLRRVGASRRQQWFIVGSHLVAGAVGIVVLGLLGTGSGFLFTGSLALVQNQLGGTLVVAAWSTLVASVLWVVLSRLPLEIRRAERVHVDHT